MSNNASWSTWRSVNSRWNRRRPMQICRATPSGASGKGSSSQQVADGDLDLVVAGTRDAVMMVESEANELSEDQMLGAVMFAHRASQKVVEAIIDLAEQAAKDPWELAPAIDPAATKATR